MHGIARAMYASDAIMLRDRLADDPGTGGNVCGWRTVVASTLLVYDISLTIDQEVHAIWRSRPSAGKYIYLIVSVPILPPVAWH